jgi:glycosyltransferase involved in cell wall biosynthesis
MNILFPIGSLYPSQAGGPSNSIYWLAKGLHSRGNKVVSVTTDQGILGDLLLDQWLQTDYGDVIYLRTGNHNLPFKMMVVAAKAIRQAQIVHLTSIFYPPSLILAVAARIWGKKIVWSVRGELDPEALRYRKWVKQLYLRLCKGLFGRYAWFHATSPEETEHIRKVMGDGVSTFEFPNYIELPAPATPHGGFYFLYLGRIHPIKALDRLLEACAESRRFKASGCRLIMAGEGDPAYFDSLKNLAAQLHLTEFVDFYGYTEGAAKQELLAGAQALFLVSHTENFGVVVVEALAQGVPVVSSIHTPWQILETHHAGFWIDNNPAQIAQTIDTILSKDFPMEAYRANARKLAQTEFDIEQNIGKIIEQYERVLKSE